MLESFIVAFTLLTAVGGLPAQASPATREQGFFEGTGMPHTKEVYLYQLSYRIGF